MITMMTMMIIIIIIIIIWINPLKWNPQNKNYE